MYRPKYKCYCPFYENEYKKGICCSGLETSSQTVMEFNTEEEKNCYIECHCTSKYPENCQLFGLLAKNFKG